MFVQLCLLLSLPHLLPAAALAEDTPNSTLSPKEQSTPGQTAPRAVKPEEIRKDPVTDAAEHQPKPENGKFTSMVPLAGYNPTYGVFVGGGYFRKNVRDDVVKSSWGFITVVSQFRQAIKTEFKGEARLNNFWRMEWRNELANGYESNFGLGNETRVQDRVDIPHWKNELEWYFPYYVSNRFAIGPGFEHKARHNHHLTPYEQATQVDPIEDQEFTAGLVFLERLDFRDIPENPSLGWLQEFRVAQIWPYGGGKRAPFTMLNFELSVFQYLLKRDLVMAVSISGGQIFGSPTYLNEFRLGGTDQLRGYYYGRFRGSNFYLEQTELRFPVYKLIGGAFFGEFGEVTAKHKDPFTRAHVSYGGGLRIGLPPDNVAKIRIDYAIGRDQRGLFVDFGHAF